MSLIRNESAGKSCGKRVCLYDIECLVCPRELGFCARGG